MLAETFEHVAHNSHSFLLIVLLRSFLRRRLKTIIALNLAIMGAIVTVITENFNVILAKLQLNHSLNLEERGDASNWWLLCVQKEEKIEIIIIMRKGGRRLRKNTLQHRSCCCKCCFVLCIVELLL